MEINPIDLLTIAGLASLGLWLEGIGCKHGFLDELFTPIPMALAGLLCGLMRGLV
ncbi:MAG: hypothetical protein L0Y50_00700 [Beijerinckiaceae bacterium]|nr:hypothetical protein [Beijerinckiaceae bacterium]MCI0734792.1 hypothetical protein [Beijerinckiaceae bacterium]